MIQIIPRKIKLFFLWALFGIILGNIFLLPIAHQSWAAVELRFFQASVNSSLQAELEWGTEIEDTAGFIIKRARINTVTQTVTTRVGAHIDPLFFSRAGQHGE